MKFNSLLLKEAVLEADGVIPPLRQDDSSSSDSEDDSDQCDGGYAKGLIIYKREDLLTCLSTLNSLFKK